MPTRQRICVVATSPIVVQFFLLPHLRQLAETFDVTLVANGDCGSLVAGLPRPPRMVVVPVERKIYPVRDLAALAALYRLFRREAFDAVWTVSPKAGLLGMTAARLAGVRYRCHAFQGEVWASRTGAMRRLLQAADRMTALLATETLVVSPTERAFLIGEGILSADRSAVLGSGSICGVDTSRFAPNPVIRETVRLAEGIPDSATLVLFLGRMQRDKGILDLIEVWRRLAVSNSNLHIAIVGPDENELAGPIRALVGPTLADRLHMPGVTSAPESWMAAADILCLPSYREGFGNVIIEAGATEVPVIASRIYGIADALVENVTGLAHPPGDRQALEHCLTRLIDDPELRRRFGRAGRGLACANYEQADVVKRYATHLAQRCGAMATS